MRRRPLLVVLTLAASLLSGCRSGASDDEIKPSVHRWPPTAPVRKDFEETPPEPPKGWTWREVRLNKDGATERTALHYPMEAVGESSDLGKLLVAASELIKPPGGDIVDCEVVIEGAKVMYEVTLEKDGVLREVLVERVKDAAGAWIPSALEFETQIPHTEAAYESIRSAAVAAAVDLGHEIDGSIFAFVEKNHLTADGDAFGYQVKLWSKEGLQIKAVLNATASGPEVSALYYEIRSDDTETETPIWFAP